MLKFSNAADLNMVKRVLRRELTWRLPRDGDVSIRIKGRDIQISGLGDAPEQPPAA